MQETAAANGISAMPTFMFFRNKTKIDSLRGADAGSLEEKIKKWYGSGDDNEDETIVKGQVSITPSGVLILLCRVLLLPALEQFANTELDRFLIFILVWHHMTFKLRVCSFGKQILHLTRGWTAVQYGAFSVLCTVIQLLLTPVVFCNYINFIRCFAWNLLLDGSVVVYQQSTLRVSKRSWRPWSSWSID